MNRGNVFGINGKIETECLTVVGAQYAPTVSYTHLTLPTKA